MKQLRSILVCLFLIMALSTNALAAPLSQTSSIHYVKSIPTGPNCSSWDDACGLQAALDKAISGDQIWVAAGTYKPTKLYDLDYPSNSINPRSATFYITRGVAVYGGFPAEGGNLEDRDPSIHQSYLSGDIGIEGTKTDNSYHVVVIREASNVSLDGFTIHNGHANHNELNSVGGGIYISNHSPTLRNIIFIDNYAQTGGGIANTNGSPTLTNVVFTYNSANDGGGMYNYNLGNSILTNVTFSGNSANRGGGMYNLNSSNPKLTNVTFSRNAANLGGGLHNTSSSPNLVNVTFSGNAAYDSGGGMYDGRSNPTLTNVSFNGNSANRGGGMFNTSSHPSLTNVTFSANSAGGSGGGILNESSSPTLTNVTFSGNSADSRGGGMADFDGSSSRLTNVTFTGNQASTSSIGGAILLGGDGSILSNVIVWGNTPSENQVGYYFQTAYANITYSIIERWTLGGTGNISTNPSLGPLANNGGFTQTHALTAGSPVIGAANPATCPATDQRGHLRFVDGSGNVSTSCDIGAHEFGYSINVGVEGSGKVTITPDRADFFDGETVTLTAIPTPGWTFSDWSGAASVTDNTLDLTVFGDTSLTATFTQDEYTLTIVPEGSGAVDKSTDQATFHYGETVTLTANPVPDWSFTGWSGDATGTANPLVLTFDGDKTITARFEQTLFRYILVPIYK